MNIWRINETNKTEFTENVKKKQNKTKKKKGTYYKDTHWTLYTERALVNRIERSSREKEKGSAQYKEQWNECTRNSKYTIYEHKTSIQAVISKRAKSKRQERRKKIKLKK